MICYYRNGISCGANIMEFKDQIVIRGKFNQIGIRQLGSLILGIFGEKKRKEREKKKKKKKRRRRKPRKV